MKKGQDGTELLLKSIAKGIFEKKGKDVLKIDLRKLDNRISDYFIAVSYTHLDVYKRQGVHLSSLRHNP